MLATREWILKKNCSISPSQLIKAYSALCAASLLIASYFTFHGAWVVMVFAVGEMLAVAFAFLYFGRHASDRDQIALSASGLVVEMVRAERSEKIRLDPSRTRVALPKVKHGLVSLEAGRDRVNVGEFVTERKRREFAKELSQELGHYAGSPQFF